MFVINKWRC